MGLKGFFKDAFEDIGDFGEALLDNPVDAIVAASIAYFSGGTAGTAIFAASAATYGNLQQERAAKIGRVHV